MQISQFIFFLSPEPQPVAAKSTPSFVASSRLASITNKSNRPTASSRGHNRSIDTFRQSTRQDIPQLPFNQLLLNPGTTISSSIFSHLSVSSSRILPT